MQSVDMYRVVFQDEFGVRTIIQFETEAEFNQYQLAEGEIVVRTDCTEEEAHELVLAVPLDNYIAASFAKSQLENGQINAGELNRNLHNIYYLAMVYNRLPEFFNALNRLDFDYGSPEHIALLEFSISLI